MLKALSRKSGGLTGRRHAYTAAKRLLPKLRRRQKPLRSSGSLPAAADKDSHTLRLPKPLSAIKRLIIAGRVTSCRPGYKPAPASRLAPQAQGGFTAPAARLKPAAAL